MVRRSRNSKRQKRHSRIAGLALLGIALATAVFVYLTFGASIQPQAFFARSINDASYDCEDKIKSRFGADLVSSQFDQYSSRYVADDHQYLIYYRVTTREELDNGALTTRDSTVKCTVWERLGYVSDFQVFNDF